MRKFFQEYGAVALGVLALLVLIAMITPIGNIIKTSLQGTTDTFATKMNAQTDAMTESMSAAFVNATDFTGAKDGKYYSHGQIVTDTVLPDGTSRGAEGWRLTDAQYQKMIENIDLLTNDNYAVVYHKYEDTAWSWHHAVYIFNINDQSDYYTVYSWGLVAHETANPIQFIHADDIVPLKSTKEVELKGYIGYYDSPTLRATTTVPVISLCETLNLDCEVGA